MLGGGPLDGEFDEGVLPAVWRRIDPGMVRSGGVFWHKYMRLVGVMVYQGVYTGDGSLVVSGYEIE